jgi:hypothetical protein
MKVLNVLSLALGILVMGSSVVAAPEVSQNHSIRHNSRASAPTDRERAFAFRRING